MHTDDLQDVDGVVDQHVSRLLQLHHRMTFLTLADALPNYSWRALFMALSRLRVREQVEMLPMVGNYELVWRRAASIVGAGVSVTSRVHAPA